jgi:hypothetical protein
MTLLNTADAIRLGSSPASAVYAGEAKVWPSFSPTSLPGLKVWLDASSLTGADGSPVSPWPNLASGGAVGSIVGTPAPKISTNRLNGKKVVRFTVPEGRLRMTNSGVVYACTLAYVARMIGPTVGRMVCGAYPPTDFLIGWYGGNMDVAYTTSGGFFTPNVQKAWSAEGTPSPWIMYSGDAGDPPSFYPRMFRNGVLMSTGSSGTAGGSDGFANTFCISGQVPDTHGESCDCEVAEVVLYDRKHSDADRQKVEDYLRGKWLA